MVLCLIFDRFANFSIPVVQRRQPLHATRSPAWLLGAGRVLQDVLRATSPGAAAGILRFQPLSMSDVPMRDSS